MKLMYARNLKNPELQSETVKRGQNSVMDARQEWRMDPGSVKRRYVIETSTSKNDQFAPPRPVSSTTLCCWWWRTWADRRWRRAASCGTSRRGSSSARWTAIYENSRFFKVNDAKHGQSWPQNRRRFCFFSDGFPAFFFAENLLIRFLILIRISKPDNNFVRHLPRIFRGKSAGNPQSLR